MSLTVMRPFELVGVIDDEELLDAVLMEDEFGMFEGGADRGR